MSSTSSSSQTKIQTQQKIAAKENPPQKENNENKASYEATTSGAPTTPQTRRPSNRTMDVNPTVPTSKNAQRSLIPSEALSAPSASPPSEETNGSSKKSSEESNDGSKGDKKGLKSAAVFAAIQKRINADTVNKVKAVYRFDITPDARTGDGDDNNPTANQKPESWLIELKEGNGKVHQADSNSPADCTIAMKDSDFVSLMTGKMNAQAAFMKGKLKVRGNIMLAQKLSALMPPPKPKSKL